MAFPIPEREGSGVGAGAGTGFSRWLITSPLVMRPSLPVPEISAGAMLFSTTAFRTAGERVCSAGFAGIEQTIAGYGKKARDGQLTIADMQGGTFTISNGGIYGSLMSTPILNAPQSGILGMHKIQERPIAVNGQVVIRPMMYLALSYDHRLVDGKQAVTFLVKVKQVIEDPTRLLLNV